MKFLLTICLFLVVYQVGYATEYIVTNLTELRNAHNVSLPGDFITLRGGEYAVDGFTINRSGNATGGYITYRNYAGETPKLIGQPTSYYTIVKIEADYIRFIGIEIYGINRHCTQQEAEANYVDSFNASPNWKAIDKTSCSGILIGKKNTFQHHVEIKKCIVHDNPGHGICSQECDYITIEGNTTYNNCFYSIWAQSGISIHTSKDLNPNASDVTATKNYITGNVSYNNKSLVPYKDAVGASPSVWKYSDGNGIIVDLNQELTYKGSTLVANNVCYYNGGSGINVVGSNNVSVLHNSTFWNGLWSDYPEFNIYDGKNLYIYNNIFYAEDGGFINKLNGITSNIYFDYNVYYNGQISQSGTNDKSEDPKYIAPYSSNFMLQPGSPAINTATFISWITKDIVGRSRPMGGVSDRGAYEYSGSARISAEEASSAMQVVVLSNPIKENVVRVKVSGVGGQLVQLRLTDIQGRLVSEKRVEQAVEGEEQQLPIDKQRAGLLLLQVSAGKESQTIKVLRQ